MTDLQRDGHSYDLGICLQGAPTDLDRGYVSYVAGYSRSIQLPTLLELMAHRAALSRDNRDNCSSNGAPLFRVGPTYITTTRAHRCAGTIPIHVLAAPGLLS